MTLQEDINRSKNLGRLTPFCRYAEAIATTIEDYQHTYDGVVARVNNKNPERLERWEIPNALNTIDGVLLRGNDRMTQSLKGEPTLKGYRYTVVVDQFWITDKVVDVIGVRSSHIETVVLMSRVENQP